jgi:hypothetical protein
LAGLHAHSSNFGRAARLSTSVPICFGVGACAIPSFGISKFAVNVWFRDTNKNANKTDGWSEFLLVFPMHRENFPEKSGIEPMA